MKPHGPGGVPRRPVIGITPDVSVGADTPARYEVKVAYAEAVLRAGGLPFIIPYSDDPTSVDAYLDRIAGLVVTGGAFDIPPQAYGEQARDGLGILKPSRTAFETALMQAALKRNVPLLGVCGGMQLLHVLLGGTLFQDLRREVPAARDHEQTNDRTQPSHPVEVKDGTQLGDLVGKGQLMVNSTHHQAAHDVPDSVVVSAVAPDGVVEAIEAKGHPFALGVQWHPELLIHNVPAHLSLYRALVHKARENRR
jgi:putative glutamine amidotransferase